jgi:actin related protein 2/3 complex subunit 1A/1B
LFAEIDTSLGWVQAARWSPSGNALAFVGQDSTLSVANVTSGTPQVDVVKFRDLPFRDLLWINETSIVAVGHDCTPVLF